MIATKNSADNVKVSVAMTTYNHKPYIAQAIEGVLMQEVSFAYELVIGEDCSPDGARRIVEDYVARNPDRIRPLLPDRNLGAHANFRETLAACRGEYIALCEGDDYWTDPHKLQKQVDFLEAHHECSLCFHNTIIWYEDGSRPPQPRYQSPQKTFWSLSDIVYRNPITTCSVVYRKELLGDYPDWYYTLPIGDWPTWVLLAEHGPAGYLDDVMATYRVHEGGAFSGRLSRSWVPGLLRVYNTFAEQLSQELRERIQEGKTDYLDQMAEEYLADASGHSSPGEAVRAYQALWTEQIGTAVPSARHLLGRLYAHRFYVAARAGDYATMRESIVRLARYDRSWFRNRGFLSQSLDAILGRKRTHHRGDQ